MHVIMEIFLRQIIEINIIHIMYTTSLMEKESLLLWTSWVVCLYISIYILTRNWTNVLKFITYFIKYKDKST
jgi:hypothetical protein